MRKLIYLILILSINSIISNNQEIKSKLNSALINKDLDRTVSLLIENKKKLFFETKSEKKQFLELITPIINEKRALLSKLNAKLNDQKLFDNKKLLFGLTIPFINCTNPQKITELIGEIGVWKIIFKILYLTPSNSAHL